MTITQLSPNAIWHYFNEICRIPRPSKKEEKIIAYLSEFGKSHGLDTRTDKAGNVLISKAATPGYENLKTVILQSHVDMVCEKNSDTVHNFDLDPIQPYIDGEWVKAKGTTLGADDGIGVAAQLAILAASDMEHGPLECLFTTDEETGLSGAFALEKNFMTGEILLNLDSEDEGELYMGCAGGIDTIALLEFMKEDVPQNLKPFKVVVKGLKGGHSGDDINKELGNANKILNRFMWECHKEFGIKVSSFNGGNLRNAIAREAEAVLLVHKDNVELLLQKMPVFINEIKSVFEVTEPGFRLEIEETEKPGFILDRDAQNKLLNVIYACPHGILGMSKTIPGLVETSTNLASVKMLDDTHIEIVTSQRSSVEAARKGAAQMLRSVFSLAGATVRHSDGYPGWKPNLNSPVLNITRQTYQSVFKVEPEVKAIHAGLECGLFLEKYPFLDMVSFGPTIKGAHSPDERIHIESVNKFWLLLTETLKRIPEKEH
ncbi:aminoacyl-histidine dipeptidase [Saccharicrinis sp. FJH54]|uniref:aminoacyl-histidine dipeptidase n=1 Tax=Saccharicrinis sp. FJH54 TaxID=3344665 RepID=UPI0035D46091